MNNHTKYTVHIDYSTYFEKKKLYTSLRYLVYYLNRSDEHNMNFNPLLLTTGVSYDACNKNM